MNNTSHQQINLNSEHICKNCRNVFTGNYCNNCGEKAYTDEDKTIAHLLHEAFHFITHFEGTFLNTLKTIIRKPGKLSEDYCDGIRKKYFKPMSFFLLLAVLYLLFPVFQGLNQNLYYHTHSEFYGNYAMKKCIEIMQTKHLSEAQLIEEFHHKAEKVSKFLLFIIIPFTALFSWIRGYKKRRLYFDHFIFCIEENSFLILWGFLVLPFLYFLLRLIGLDYVFKFETFNITATLLFFIPHIFFAARRFFGYKILPGIIFAIAYTFILGLVIQYIYKFILFFITINQF